MTKRVEFTTRKTPHGCTVTYRGPKHTNTKRFRNGYAAATASARNWIEEQLEVLREEVAMDHIEPPEVYLDGKLQKGWLDAPKPIRTRTEAIRRRDAARKRSVVYTVGDLRRQLAKHPDEAALRFSVADDTSEDPGERWFVEDGIEDCFCSSYGPGEVEQEITICLVGKSNLAPD